MNRPIDNSRTSPSPTFFGGSRPVAETQVMAELLGLTGGDGFEASSLTADQIRAIQSRIQSDPTSAGDRMAFALQLLQLSGGQLPPDLLAQLLAGVGKKDALGRKIAPTLTPTSAVTPKTAKSEPYAVKSGDSLSKIAAANGVTLAQLKAANPGLFDAKHKNGDLIQPGEKVVIPMKTEEPARTTQVQVKEGDTLSKIAARFGLSLDDLKAANPGLFDKAHEGGDLIRPGEQVQIPPRKPRNTSKTVDAKKTTDSKKTETTKTTEVKKTEPTNTAKAGLTEAAANRLQTMKAIVVTSDGFKKSAADVEKELAPKLDEKGRASLKTALAAAHEARFAATPEARIAGKAAFDKAMKEVEGQLTPEAAKSIREVVDLYPTGAVKPTQPTLVPTNKNPRLDILQ